MTGSFTLIIYDQVILNPSLTTGGIVFGIKDQPKYPL